MSDRAYTTVPQLGNDTLEVPLTDCAEKIDAAALDVILQQWRRLCGNDAL